MDFRPRLQSHLFVLEPLFLLLLRVLSFHISRYCIIHWCMTEPYLWDIYENLCPWKHQHAELQTGCKLPTALSALRRESEHRASIEKSIADQLVIAAEVKPKRFRTKWQRTVYDGPTARKDAEASERDRWIQLLANLLRSTVTPIGIQSALWTTLRNTEHRMRHWLQLVAIPNAPSSSSSQELQSLKKRISDLEKARSRSPRRNVQKQLALPSGPQMIGSSSTVCSCTGKEGEYARSASKKQKRWCLSCSRQGSSY